MNALHFRRSYLTLMLGTSRVMWIAVLISLLPGKQCGSAFAQTKNPSETEDPKDTGLTCEQILQMRLDKFVDYYDKKFGANARSEYKIYIKCRQEANTGQIKRLPAAAQKQINGLRKTLAEWETDALQMGYYREGKGSIFTTFGLSIECQREDLVGTIARTMKQQSRPSKNARRSAGRALRYVEESFTAADAAGRKIDNEDNRSEYNRALIKWKFETLRLKLALKELPDVAAAMVVPAIESTLKSVREGYM